MINDVTGKDISELNDSDLRDLIGKLCEATLKKYGIDPICTTYGGNQDEPDGGVDVRVESIEKFNDDWPIPRNNTIIQVKKPSMPNSAIEKEMMNKDGSIKECIKKLVKLKGAYIIISSSDSLADKRKNQRVSCMKNILSSIDKMQKIKVDFYDNKRIATWVKQFPALVMWVNEKTHKRTSGWNTYYNWSSPNEIEKDYIIDEKMSLHRENFEEQNLLSIEEGINEIRNLLLQEKKVVRLAGLSGVGKTRFAQALFDKNIGKNFLNKEKVIYCDIGNSPNPMPITFIQELIILNESIIVIIDNCNKELHNKLAEYVCLPSSKISLLTIEYDVKDDTNIESYNYYLDTSSDNIIRKLLKRDFSYIEDNNIETIVKCSNGNFRIATYLAKTFNKNENIGILTSNEMFKRLFFQNNTESEDLLDTGRICSIFISFNIEYNKEDYNNELNIIGRIIDKKTIELLKYIKELNNRQIVQNRGNMRAILPHAIANRLANEFLESIPIDFLINEIKNCKRLQLSFFRRLKFLHNKEYSIQSANFHLEQINFLNVNKYEIEIIDCIKVISPEKVLNKLEQITQEKFFTINNNYCYEWAIILFYIAYDQKLFYRSTILIAEFAKSEEKNKKYKSIRDILYKMFHIALSGTHATIEDRLKILDTLIYDSSIISNELGLKLINELLKLGTNGLSDHIIDNNTSVKRDYGYYPKNKEEYRKWYITTLQYCEKLIINNVFEDEIKEIISNNFRDLASNDFYYDLEKIVENVLINKSWPEIWITIEAIKHFDKKKIPKKMLIQMNILQEKCTPKTIDDKIKIFLNNYKYLYWDLDDSTENEKKSNEIIKQLGIEVRNNKETLKENLLKINDSCSLYRIDYFTDGLFEENNNHHEIIYFLLNNINQNNKNIFLRIISTYISHINEDEKRNQLLDEILNNKKYNKNYPIIQFGYQLNNTDIIRIRKAITLGIGNIHEYYGIMFYIKNISISEIIYTINLFPKNDESDILIISILNYLYFNKRNTKKLNEYSRNFIMNLDFTNPNYISDNQKNKIKKIVKECFSGNNDKIQVINIFKKFINVIDKNINSYYEYQYILNRLIKLYPYEFLDVLLGNSDIEQYKIKYFIKGSGHHKNPIDLIGDDTLIKWIVDNNKALDISDIINPIIIIKESEEYKWKKVSIYLIENYINNKIIIDNLIKGIYPNSWIDKYSKILKNRLRLAKELMEHSNKKIQQLGLQLEQKLNKDISIWEEQEKNEQDRYNTFE